MQVPISHMPHTLEASGPSGSMLFSLHVLLFMCAMLCYTILQAALYMLVGWEYLGLMSYLLIQHWGCRVLALMGGAKALLYNRIADLLLVAAV